MNGEHEGPRTEPGIGRSLREAREERGLTLGQVEERTKVRARYLQDLERENFDVLPVVYVLGSLKTYADHLGLNGEALSADLKRRLEPEELENLPEEPAKAGSERDREDEYEAAPLITVGFDHLFLGMGLVLIFGLAAMTLVFALITNDGPVVSQIREPAIPETPSEIALAGNFLERPERQPRSQVAPSEPQSREDEGRNTEKEDEDPAEKLPDPPGQQPEDAPSQDSLFDDVKFVPAPSFSPPATGTASASASASPLPTVSTSSASASPAPVDPPATTSASPEPSSPEPSSPEPSSPEPVTDAPVDTASTAAPAAATVAAEPAPGPAGSAPSTARTVPAAAGVPNGSGLRGAPPGGMDASSLVDGIDARVDAAVDPLR